MNTLDPANINLSNEIARYIEAQKGATVSAPELATKFKAHPSRIRGCISLGRSMGRPICSNAKGYYWSFEPNDLQNTIKHIEDRIKKQQEAVNGLKEWLV
jgi:hypothetical protein